MKIYIAIPYSGQEEKSFKRANEVAAQLMNAGHLVYSPISHSHPIAQHGLPGDWEYWQKVDKWMMKSCDTIVVIDDDWEAVKASKGIREELAIAAKLSMDVLFYNQYTW